MKVKKPTLDDDERPDAWQRFERAVDIALHTRPTHKEAQSGRRRKKSKKAVKSRP
jgi:hypothetical protein